MVPASIVCSSRSLFDLVDKEAPSHHNHALANQMGITYPYNSDASFYIVPLGHSSIFIVDREALLSIIMF